MYDTYKNTGDSDTPGFRLTVLKREKPSIQDILLAAADTPGSFSLPAESL